MKNYNSKMAINVPDNENVINVNMGTCTTLDTFEPNHLLTYGLGPCVGISIVIKEKYGKVTRLLAHIDIGQTYGMTFSEFKEHLKELKSNITTKIEKIEISLTSIDSYQDMDNLSKNEKTLLGIILIEFQEFGITINNISFNNSSQVQISPDGIISTYSDAEVEEHKEKILIEDLKKIGGFVEPNLNIYITEYGAYMGNLSLNINCSENDKQNQFSNPYWKKLIENGYDLVIAPSFNDPNTSAMYVKNWNDINIQKYGTVPGCIQARQTTNLNHKHI